MDFQKLDSIVARFRKGSPNIAAAFDEVKVLIGHPGDNAENKSDQNVRLHGLPLVMLSVRTDPYRPRSTRKRVRCGWGR